MVKVTVLAVNIVVVTGLYICLLCKWINKANKDARIANEKNI